MHRLRGSATRRLLAKAVLAALLLGAIGAYLGWGRDQRHAATATILITPLEGNPFSPDGRDGLVNLSTEARLVTSDAVARAVALEVGSTQEAVLSRVEVEVPSNTQLVKVTVTRRNADTSRAVANAFAEAFLAQRRERTESTVSARTAHLDDESEKLRKELATLTEERAEPGITTAREALLDQQISGLVSQTAQIDAEKTALGYVSRDPGQVVTPALAEPPGPVPAVAIGAGVGAFLGVAIVLGLAWVGARRRDLVGDRTDLEAAGYDLVGSVQEPDALRSRVLVGVGTGPAVVVLADVGRDVGASRAVARGLSASLSSAGVASVLVLLSGDGESAGTGPGVAEVAAGAIPLSSALQATGTHGHRVGPGGRGGGGNRVSGDVLASPGFAALLEELRGRGEVIICAGLSAPGPDARLLFAHSDAVALVATTSVSTRADLETVLADVEQSPALGLGLVHHEMPRRGRWTGRNSEKARDQKSRDKKSRDTDRDPKSGQTKPRRTDRKAARVGSGSEGLE